MYYIYYINVKDSCTYIYLCIFKNYYKLLKINNKCNKFFNNFAHSYKFIKIPLYKKAKYEY